MPRMRYEVLPTTATASSPIEEKHNHSTYTLAKSILHSFRRLLINRARLLVICGALPSLAGLYYISSQCNSYSPYSCISDDYDPEYTHPQDHTHLIFEHVFETQASYPNSSFKLTPTRTLPAHCIDQHISQGAPCSDGLATKFDLLWTWVNGSDPRFLKAYTEASKEPEIVKSFGIVQNLPTVESKQYRDHDELRHSLRSALQHFRPHASRFHIYGSDFPYPSDSNSSLRIGQLPSWLDPSSPITWRDGNVSLDVQYQSQVFKGWENGPSFNSYSIESQFGGLMNVTGYFIYFNDDFFFTSDVTPSDFYTSSYGPVLRMQPDLLVQPSANGLARGATAGEWGPLGYTSYLLSQRFGHRARPYIAHVPKTLSMPHLEEISYIWEDELRRTSRHKFRGMRDSVGTGADAYMAFLFNHFMVERYREALLWSWVVGHVGGKGNEWGEFERLLAWTEVGGNPEVSWQDLSVNLGLRESANEKRVWETLKETGESAKEWKDSKTRYTFSSADGYPYSYTRGARGGGAKAWPQFTQSWQTQQVCQLNFNKCFMEGINSASEVFVRVAFEKPQECGDCIIHALRGASGPLGLSAFIPPPSKIFVPEATTQSPPTSSDPESGEPHTFTERQLFGEFFGGEEGSRVPHLPLVKDWRDGDFSLRSVLTNDSGKPINVRGWVLRLLERYRFIIGDTPSMFVMIKSEMTARSQLAEVDRQKDLALLCLNDDVDRRPELADRVLRTWLDRRFLKPAEWER